MSTSIESVDWSVRFLRGKFPAHPAPATDLGDSPLRAIALSFGVMRSWAFP
jgi:hypothetical protein